ncbi:MAG: metal-dependent hydrolase [Campylobacterales bacterium]|nr:metal-dependent hydrolase [Campylobacterales bacterium]
MASFEQHVNGAVISSGVLIVPLHSASIIQTTESIILLALALIGGVLPDLDSDNSKPIQIVFKIVSIFLPLIVILAIPNDLSIFYLVIYWLLSTLILRITLFQLFISFTTHRGIFHSIPMGIVFAQITTYILYKAFDYDLIFSTISGAFLFFGFIVHLLLDEIVSLNALGIRVKKSFGTAFKFYDSQNIMGTLLLYIFIILFFIYLPIKIDIFLDIFEVFKNTKLL